MLARKIRTMSPNVSIAKTDLAIMTSTIENVMITAKIKSMRDLHLVPSAEVVVGAEGIKALVDVDVTARSPSRMTVTMTIPDARSIEADDITTMKRIPPVPRTRIKTRTTDMLIETAPHRRQSPNDPATAAVVIETQTSGRIKTTIVVMIVRSPGTAPRIEIRTMIASDAGTRTEIAATKTARIAKIDIGIGTDVIATETGTRTEIVRVIGTATESATQDTAADTNRLTLGLLPTTKTPSLLLALAVTKQRPTLRVEPKARARTLTHLNAKLVIASVCSKKRSASQA